MTPQPLTTPSGTSRAILRHSPAFSATSTTADTSLYAWGVSSAKPRQDAPRGRAEEKAAALGYQALAYLRSYAVAAVDTGWQLLMGPVYAVPKAVAIEGK